MGQSFIANWWRQRRDWHDSAVGPPPYGASAIIGGVSEGSNAATSLIFNLYNGSSSAEQMRITSAGMVGIGTTTPQATLDVNGYMRLAKNTAQPVACSSTNDGAVALTHVYTLCICKGSSTSWVQSKDGTTACSW
jgi:hypothetical protein